MKKIILSVAVVTTLVTTLIAATNVVNVNVVGYNKQDISGSSFSLIAPAFDPVGGGSWTLAELFSTNKLQASNLQGSADKVYLWDTANAKWDQYFQKLNGNFYNVLSTSTPTNPVVDVGEGFFVQSVVSTQRVMTMLGEVVPVATQSVDIVVGFQALGYPFSSDVMLGDMAFTNSGTKSNLQGGADKVYIYENGQYVQVFMKLNNLWYRTDNTSVPTNVTIKIGQGFWYQAKNPYTNEEPSPYVDNL